jgi:hypothetical protein
LHFLGRNDAQELSTLDEWGRYRVVSTSNALRIVVVPVSADRDIHLHLERLHHDATEMIPEKGDLFELLISI